MKDRAEKASALAGLNEYWFGYGSPTTMGLFRILVSSLCFINFAMILVDFDSWFGERGFVPQAVARQWSGQIGLNPWGVDLSKSLPFDHFPQLNLLSPVANDGVTLAFYLATMAAALLSAFGLWSRLSTILMAIGVVTLHHRNPIILHGGDTVLRVFCLYVALAPSGAACSLDRLIGIWKGRIRPTPVRVSLWPQRLMSFNVGLIYLTTFWHKFGFGSYWRNFTATWFPARLNEFKRFPVPGFFNDLPMVYFTTAGTLLVELSLGTLVFYRPLRKWVLLAGLMMHGFIEYSMNIPLFAFMMAATYVTFYEGEEVEAWAKGLGARFGKWRVRVFLPLGMQLKPAAAAALDAADPLQLVAFLPGDTPSWSGRRGEKAINPFRASLWRSVGAWPIGLVPYLWRRLLNGSLEKAADAPPAAPELSRKAKAKR